MDCFSNGDLEFNKRLAAMEEAKGTGGVKAHAKKRSGRHDSAFKNPELPRLVALVMCLVFAVGVLGVLSGFFGGGGDKPITSRSNRTNYVNANASTNLEHTTTQIASGAQGLARSDVSNAHVPFADTEHTSAQIASNSEDLPIPNADVPSTSNDQDDEKSSEVAVVDQYPTDGSGFVSKILREIFSVNVGKNNVFSPAGSAMMMEMAKHLFATKSVAHNEITKVLGTPYPFDEIKAFEKVFKVANLFAAKKGYEPSGDLKTYLKQNSDHVDFISGLSPGPVNMYISKQTGGMTTEILGEAPK
eukprot:171625_1